MFAEADPPNTHDPDSFRPDRTAIPECPYFLDAVAKAKWAKLCDLLGETGLLSQADRTAESALRVLKPILGVL
jgi:phage terminase small subunit